MNFNKLIFLRKCFISLFLFFIILSDYSISEAEEIKVIKARGGLRMRDAPGLSGKKIGLIPDRSEVMLLEETGKKITIAGAGGKWSRVEWKGKTGWVFGGFLGSSVLLLDKLPGGRWKELRKNPWGHKPGYYFYEFCQSADYHELSFGKNPFPRYTDDGNAAYMKLYVGRNAGEIGMLQVRRINRVIKKGSKYTLFIDFTMYNDGKKVTSTYSRGMKIVIEYPWKEKNIALVDKIPYAVRGRHFKTIENECSR